LAWSNLQELSKTKSRGIKMNKQKVVQLIEHNLERLYDERIILIKGNNDLSLNAGSIVALNRLLLDLQKLPV